MKYIDFNINNYCTVVLTETGAAILNQHNKESNQRFEKLGIHLVCATDYKAGDTFKDQFWSMMQLFGPHCSLGLEAPFETCHIKLHLPN